MPSFAFQKASNYNAKGRLLAAKRRPFANLLAINRLTCALYRPDKPYLLIGQIGRINQIRPITPPCKSIPSPIPSGGLGWGIPLVGVSVPSVWDGCKLPPFSPFTPLIEPYFIAHIAPMCAKENTFLSKIFAHLNKNSFLCSDFLRFEFYYKLF